MSRRIVTAREQYEMLAPWRTAMPAAIPCQNCGQPKGLHGYGHQFGPCPGQKDRFGPNASRWKPPFDYQPPGRTSAAHPDSHPDLHEVFRVHGTVHTTGGRVLPAWRTADEFPDSVCSCRTTRGRHPPTRRRPGRAGANPAGTTVGR